ncbi:MAG TPA: FtsJ-like methyltransferase family protein, partial [Thermoplasmata archaeon]
TDHARSVALVRAAFALAAQVLREGGTFVAKVFDGDLLDELDAELRPAFERLVRTKPPASRAASSEMYLLGFGYRRVQRTGR